jgi:hypothetical protein
MGNGKTNSANSATSFEQALAFLINVGIILPNFLRNERRTASITVSMKPALFVALLLACVVLFSRAGGDTGQPNPPNSNQRYMMFSPQITSGSVGSTASSETYVIDTQTGQLWKSAFFSDVKDFYMAPVGYLNASLNSVSATPPVSTASESLNLQNRFQNQVEHKQKESGKK